jgi:selenocysteine lyase/cysteine desulfurase
MNIDILCVPGHKGLMGPMGTGLLLLSDEIELVPFKYGGTGSGSMSPDQPLFYPDRLESGTVNMPGIAGLKAGVDFIGRVGIKSISERESELIKALREDFKKADERIEELESKPAKRYETFVTALLTGLGTGIIGYFLGLILH